MNDTNEAFRKLVYQKMMEHSPKDRMRMGSDMHKSTRALIMVSLSPELSDL